MNKFENKKVTEPTLVGDVLQLPQVKEAVDNLKEVLEKYEISDDDNLQGVISTSDMSFEESYRSTSYFKYNQEIDRYY